MVYFIYWLPGQRVKSPALISDDYHKITMIKKRTPSNLGQFLGFICQSVMAITVKSGVLVTYLLCGLVLASCSDLPDDEQYIHQSMQRIEAAAEAKSSKDILDYLADDFLGNKVLRKANIKGMLFLYFRRHKNIHVFLQGVSVVITGNSAQVSCQVILAGREDRIMPERAKVLEIKSRWQKRGDEWLIVEANWKDPLLEY